MAGLWEAFEARFKPNYGQSLIAQLAEDAGGAKNDKRYFVASRENAIAYQRALNAWDMGIAGAERPHELKRDRQAKALLIPRSVAEKAGFFPTGTNEPEPTMTAAAVPVAEPIAVSPPEPTMTMAAAPETNPEPIAVPEPRMTTAAVTVPNQPDLGTWDDEPKPLPDEDLEAMRTTIKGNPKAADGFKPLVPRSQWKQAGIEEVELCAA
jgi:hypothetical protein